MASTTPDAALPSLRRRVGSLTLRLPLLIAVGIVLAAVFSPFIAPHDPELAVLGSRLLPPVGMGGTTEFLLGTDALGRDIFSRLLFGARASMLVAFFGVAISGLVGSTLGIVSGYVGGWVDAVIMRVVDTIVGMPIIFPALLAAIAWGSSMLNLVLVIGLIIWARFARVVRSEVLTIKSSEYVALAKVAGRSSIWIMLKHVFPNVTNTILVLATLQLGNIIILESSLSFLGVGIPPPTPAWGSMLAAGRDYLSIAWWIAVFPGVMIFITVLAFNMLGDSLRDALDPRLKSLGSA